MNCTGTTPKLRASCATSVFPAGSRSMIRILPRPAARRSWSRSSTSRFIRANSAGSSLEAKSLMVTRSLSDRAVSRVARERV